MLLTTEYVNPLSQGNEIAIGMCPNPSVAICIIQLYECKQGSHDPKHFTYLFLDSHGGLSLEIDNGVATESSQHTPILKPVELWKCIPNHFTMHAHYDTRLTS